MGRGEANACVTTVDAVALIVQIHLQQNRNDLAVKEVTAAKRWAQDNIIVNLAESWVGLRLVRSPDPIVHSSHRHESRIQC